MKPPAPANPIRRESARRREYYRAAYWVPTGPETRGVAEQMTIGADPERFSDELFHHAADLPSQRLLRARAFRAACASQEKVFPFSRAGPSRLIPLRLQQLR